MSAEGKTTGAVAPRVLLVSMPVPSPHHPALGLSLLQAALRRENISADIRHFYLDFVEYVGVDAYRAVSNDKYFLALVGEWLFAPAAGMDVGAKGMGYVSDVLLGEFFEHMSADALAQIIEVRGAVEPFIQHCLERVRWSDYDIVGFSLCFQQTMASAALAAKVRSAHPQIKIMFGGANTEGEMGAEMLRHFTCIDAIVAGEADAVIAEVVRSLAESRHADLPGVAMRGSLADAKPRKSEPVTDLDALPVPDFADFERDLLSAPTVAANFQFVPLFESARGCWWGQTEHCTFCGLNALGMAYRSKSPERAFEELTLQADRYGRELLVVDNILDHKYFKTFLPRLAALEDSVLLHYEVKANLREAQMELLAAAGIRKIQPGIESLSTRVLKLMRKGVSAIRNVQTLKLAAEAGVSVEWGHLLGFPGERVEDYDEILALMPKLHHLAPPASVAVVRADRFSPYFATPEAFAIEVNPLRAYPYIFPFGDEGIRRIAYHFEIAGVIDDELRRVHARLRVAATRWRDSAARLSAAPVGDALRIVDSRKGEERVWALDAVAAAVLSRCAEIAGVRQVAERLSPRFGAAAINEAIEALAEADLLMREDDALLSLALRQPGWDRAPRGGEIRTSLARSYFHQRRTELGDKREALDHSDFLSCGQ